MVALFNWLLVSLIKLLEQEELSVLLLRVFQKSVMNIEYGHQNFQNASFQNQDLTNVRFTDSDLRGTDFTGADLSGAHFKNIKTGISPRNVAWLFFTALCVSLLSGFFAMLVGRMVQTMLASEDDKIRIAGIFSIVMIVVFIAYALWKGGRNTINHLLLPSTILAILTGVVAYFSGLGTGRGMLYLVLSFFLLVVMFVVGTIARAAAGTLSNIIFLVVALAGGMFGKSIGGGIGTVLLAVSCAYVSKKALAGAKGFEYLKKIAFAITTRFGTSFRNSIMTDVYFFDSKIQNADFSNTDISHVNWGNSKKTNCLIDQNIITEKKSKKQ